jgi:hypothetical protein
MKDGIRIFFRPGNGRGLQDANFELITLSVYDVMTLHHLQRLLSFEH